jgi:hypothetical protein
VLAKDRDPDRTGGPLFRSNIRMEPGAKKRKVITVKKATTSTTEKETSEVKERTFAEDMAYDRKLAKATQEVDEFEIKEQAPASEGSDSEAPMSSMYVVDTGAGQAISSDRRWFSHLGKGQTHTFEYGNGGTSTTALQGTVRFSILRPTCYYDNISIQEVAFDKDCNSNLLSAYYLATQGYHHIQSKFGKFLYFLDDKNRFRFVAVAIDEVYYLPSKQPNVNAKVLSAKSSHQLRTERVLREWHPGLGHVGIGRLMNILSRDIIEDASHLARQGYGRCTLLLLHVCTWEITKIFRHHISVMSCRNMVGEKSSIPLHTLRMDAVGKMKVKVLYTARGHIYALAVVDEATACIWYFVMKSPKAVGKMVKVLIKKLEKQFPSKVKRLRTDGGSEFVNAVRISYCAKKGLVYQQSNVESQGENGSAERAHQTLMGKVRCALIGSGMAAKWWPEALLYTTIVNNRIPTARLQGKSPYEALFGRKPSEIPLQIWGSTCYAHVPKTKRANQKFSERAIECKLLGFSDSYKGYRLLDQISNRYLIARDVKFGLNSTEGLIDKSFPSGEIKSNTESIEEVCALGKRPRQDSTQVSHKRTRVDTDTPATFESIGAVGDPKHRESVPPIPRSRRKRTPNLRLRDYVVSVNAVMTSTKVVPIPRSLKDAKRGPYSKQWEAAVQVEYQALVANNTWEIVPLPNRRKAFGCHWDLMLSITQLTDLRLV